MTAIKLLTDEGRGQMPGRSPTRPLLRCPSRFATVRPTEHDAKHMENDLPYRAITLPPRLRLSDSIAAQIEEFIVEGKLRPGQTLPPERLLAQQFGVSRPSLREALLKLEARGLLRVERSGGFSVTDVTAPTMTDPLVHLLRRHPNAQQDVLEMRRGLEMVAAYFAASRATKDDRVRLRRAFDQMIRTRAKGDILADADADAAFHLTVAEASHNVALIHVMRGIYNLMRTSMHHAWRCCTKTQTVSDCCMDNTARCSAPSLRATPIERAKRRICI